VSQRPFTFIDYKSQRIRLTASIAYWSLNRLADSLDLEMPDLPEDEGTTKMGGSVVKEGSSSKDKEVCHYSIVE